VGEECCSAPDNYFANQYSTDENLAQPVPADFNKYHKLKHVFNCTVRFNYIQYTCEAEQK